MSSTEVKYTLTLADLLSGKLDNADRVANRLHTTMSGLQGTINKVGAAVGIAFGLNAIRQFANSIVDAGTKVEDAQVGLTTLLKSSEGAKDVIKNVMEDATKTPFAFEGLLQANKALISANASAKEARETVLDLANAIAATSGGDNELQRMVVNLQQIKNVGKATALDIKQFAFAGINIYQAIAKATGVNVDKVKDMEVSYDMLRFALKKAHEEGGIYANGLENMAGNTSVGISNLGDAMFQLKVKIFDDLKPAITDLLHVGMDLIHWLGDAWEWAKRNKETIFALAKGVVVGVIAFKAYKLAVQAAVLWSKIQYASIVLLGDGFLTANVATKLFAGSLQMIKTAIMSNPIGIAVTAIGALTAAYFAFSDSADKAKESQQEFSKSLIDPFTGWADKTEEMITGIADKYAKMTKGIGKNGEVLKYTIKEQNELIQSEIDQLIKSTQANALKIPGVNTLDPATAITINKLKGWKQVVAKHPEKIGDQSDKEKFDLSTTNKSSVGKVSGTRQVNIKIDIGDLIKEQTIKVTNMIEGAAKVKEMVTQALLAAVNDAQIVAGQ